MGSMMNNFERGVVTMLKKILGNTGLEISALSFGGMEIRRLEDEGACRILNAALDGGINYIDTSPEYTFSEEQIGRAISHRRGEFVLATKCGDTMDKSNPYSYDEKTLLKNLEESLLRMNTDYIDVWQLHALLPEMLPGGDCDEAISCMQRAVNEGKVRFLGASMRNGQMNQERYPDMFTYDTMNTVMHWKNLDVFQVVYGAMTRSSERRLHKAASLGKGIIARGAIKRYKEGYDLSWEKAGLEELFEQGESKADFLVRYSISHKGIASSVIGTASPEHLLMNIKAAEKGPLSAEVYAEAQRRLEGAGFSVLAE